MNLPKNIFLCSTYTDLSEERKLVLDAIRRLQLQHDSMEFFGARAERPIETCLEEVRQSNILVVIVGHRYGSLVPELGISFSEAEYKEGYSLDKPCLVYIRDDNFRILPNHIERDPDKIKKLERWKATLRERHTVAAFGGANELAVQIAADLGRTLNHLEATAHSKEEAREDPPGQVLDPIMPALSDEAKVLLKEASQDKAGAIIYRRYFGGSAIQTNNKNLIPDKTRRTVAKWEEALQELVEEELVIERGYEGAIFELTSKGYQVADSLEL